MAAFYLDLKPSSTPIQPNSVRRDLITIFPRPSQRRTILFECPGLSPPS